MNVNNFLGKLRQALDKSRTQPAGEPTKSYVSRAKDDHIPVSMEINNQFSLTERDAPVSLSISAPTVNISTKKDSWDIINILAKLTGAIAVPVAIIWFGIQYQTADNIGLVKSEYVKLAIEILSTDPNEDNLELRRWAVDVLDTNSEVDIPEDLKIRMRCEKEILEAREKEPDFSLEEAETIPSQHSSLPAATSRPNAADAPMPSILPESSTIPNNPAHNSSAWVCKKFIEQNN